MRPLLLLISSRTADVHTSNKSLGTIRSFSVLSLISMISLLLLLDGGRNGATEKANIPFK